MGDPELPDKPEPEDNLPPDTGPEDKTSHPLVATIVFLLLAALVIFSIRAVILLIK